MIDNDGVSHTTEQRRVSVLTLCVSNMKKKEVDHHYITSHHRREGKQGKGE